MAVNCSGNKPRPREDERFCHETTNEISLFNQLSGRWYARLFFTAPLLDVRPE
jgi:hypothetical protein